MSRKRAFLISVSMAVLVFVISIPITVIAALFLLSVGKRGGVNPDLFFRVVEDDSSAIDWAFLIIAGIACIGVSAWAAWGTYSSGYAVLSPLKTKPDSES